jgi:hypothetical protein
MSDVSYGAPAGRACRGGQPVYRLEKEVIMGWLVGYVVAVGTLNATLQVARA